MCERWHLCKAVVQLPELKSSLYQNEVIKRKFLLGYLFDKRIEISSILSFVGCMWIAVILALNGLLYTAKTWRPFIRQVALPGSKLCQSKFICMVIARSTCRGP